MITGEQGARKPASPVREETDGKGPSQGHLAGGRLHSARAGGCDSPRPLTWAPALLRSQVLSLLYQAVRRGEMTRKEAERHLEYVRARAADPAARGPRPAERRLEGRRPARVARYL